MKKIIALVLVLVVALVVFSSCAKKEEAKEETAKIAYTIINKTGENVKDITLKEKIGSKNQEWGDKLLENDGEITITVDTVVQNGAPSIDFSYALESGNALLVEKIQTKGDKTITLKVDENGSAVAEIAEKQ